jgi:hypothetical protein
MSNCKDEHVWVGATKHYCLRCKVSRYSPDAVRKCHTPAEPQPVERDAMAGQDEGSFLICIHCGKGVGEGIGEDCHGAEDTMHDFQESRDVAEQVATCGNISPGWKVKMSCVKPQGHSGNHEDSVGCWWRNYSIPSLPAEPVERDAMAEQVAIEPTTMCKCGHTRGFHYGYSRIAERWCDVPDCECAQFEAGEPAEPQAGAQRKHAWKTGAAASDTYCLNCGVHGFMPMAAEECPNGALLTPKQAGAQVPSREEVLDICRVAERVAMCGHCGRAIVVSFQTCSNDGWCKPAEPQAGAQPPSQADKLHARAMECREDMRVARNEGNNSAMDYLDGKGTALFIAARTVRELEARITELEASNAKLFDQLHKHVAFRGVR